jgi:hypothetical protein
MNKDGRCEALTNKFGINGHDYKRCKNQAKYIYSDDGANTNGKLLCTCHKNMYEENAKNIIRNIK